MIFKISRVVAPLLALSYFVDADVLDSSLVSRNLARQHTKLSAVTVRSKLQRREDPFKPKRDRDHEYAEGMSITFQSLAVTYSFAERPSLPGWNSRFARTQTKYKLPTLSLEDIEEDVEHIRCSDSTITVQFSETQNLEDVRPHWDNLGPFMLITSHIGCNEDGERKPYLVSAIHYDISKHTAGFSVLPIEWRQAYETMTVKFGSKPGKYPSSSFRTHEGLKRRQDGDTIVVSTSTLSPPIPTPTGYGTSVDLANPFNSSQKLDPDMTIVEFASG